MSAMCAITMLITRAPATVSAWLREIRATAAAWSATAVSSRSSSAVCCCAAAAGVNLTRSGGSAPPPDTGTAAGAATFGVFLAVVEEEDLGFWGPPALIPGPSAN